MMRTTRSAPSKATRRCEPRRGPRDLGDAGAVATAEEEQGEAFTAPAGRRCRPANAPKPSASVRGFDRLISMVYACRAQAVRCRSLSGLSANGTSRGFLRSLGLASPHVERAVGGEDRERTPARAHAAAHCLCSAPDAPSAASSSHRRLVRDRDGSPSRDSASLLLLARNGAASDNRSRGSQTPVQHGPPRSYITPMPEAESLRALIEHSARAGGGDADAICSVFDDDAVSSRLRQPARSRHRRDPCYWKGYPAAQARPNSTRATIYVRDHGSPRSSGARAAAAPGEQVDRGARYSAKPELADLGNANVLATICGG